MGSPLKLLDFLVKQEKPEPEVQELQKSWPLSVAAALILAQSVDDVPHSAPPKLLAGFRQAGIVPPEERWKPEALHPELLPIAHLESSFGLKVGHDPCPGGEYHTAMGALGLKPVTAHEAYKQSKALQKEYPGLDDPKAFTNKLKDDNRFYNLAASAHWVQLKKIHGTPEKAAFAWRWGSGAAQKAAPEKIAGDNYVQKYQEKVTQPVKKAYPENPVGKAGFHVGLSAPGTPGREVEHDAVREAGNELREKTPQELEPEFPIAGQLKGKRTSWATRVGGKVPPVSQRTLETLQLMGDDVTEKRSGPSHWTMQNESEYPSQAAHDRAMEARRAVQGTPGAMEGTVYSQNPEWMAEELEGEVREAAHPIPDFLGHPNGTVQFRYIHVPRGEGRRLVGWGAYISGPKILIEARDVDGFQGLYELHPERGVTRVPFDVPPLSGPPHAPSDHAVHQHLVNWLAQNPMAKAELEKAWPKTPEENLANQPAFLSGHPGAEVARDAVLEATGATETPHGPENQAAKLDPNPFSWRRPSGQDRWPPGVASPGAGRPPAIAPMQVGEYRLPGQPVGTNPESEARSANYVELQRLAGRHPSHASLRDQEPVLGMESPDSQKVRVGEYPEPPEYLKGTSGWGEPWNGRHPETDEEIAAEARRQQELAETFGPADRQHEQGYWRRIDAMSRAGGLGVPLSRIKKSIQDLKPSNKPLGEGTWDYSHMLTPEERAQGLSMTLVHRNPPPHKGNPSLTALLQEADKTGKLHERGYVEAFVHYGTHLMPHSKLDDQFRGRGLGARLYLATFAHAYHHLGIRRIEGGHHTDEAGGVHESFKRRYGWNYRPGRGLDVSSQTKRGDYDYTLKNELTKTDCDLWLAQQTLVKAVKPEELKPVSRYDDHALGEVFVNDEFEPDSHPQGNDVFAQAFRHHVVEDPKPIKRGKTGTRESSNSTGKVVYDIKHPIGEHGDTHRFMVKSYHEKIAPRCRAWQQFPIQGWAEMTNQALYHAGEIGHMHQRVHVDRLPMVKTGKRGVPERTVEAPVLVVHMQPNVRTVEHLGTGAGRALGSNGANPKIQQQARQIWLMDFLTQNLDRHWSNLLYDEKNDSLLAIDHSRSFQYTNTKKDPVDHKIIPRGQFTDTFGNYGKLGLQQVMDNRVPYFMDGSHPGYLKLPDSPEGKEYKALRDQHKWKSLDAWNEKWNPTFEWWGRVKDKVVDAWKKRLNLVKEKAVREHLDRNFMERVKLLNDYAHYGIENFGRDSWDDTPVTLFRYGTRDHED